MVKYIYIVLGGVLIICLLPVASPFVAVLVANLAGCALDEGSAHTCMIFGTDWAETLYFLFVVGWLGLATLPIAALALLLIGLVAIGNMIFRRLRRRQGEKH